jgi:nucleoside-diphosphate-sugar epimerase
MRVLVTGAGGFLGRHVTQCLLDHGHTVRAIIRPSSVVPEWKGEVEVFRADLRVSDELSSAFQGIDVLLHLAAATSGSEDMQFASTVVATERLLCAMTNSSVKRLIHVSSLVVYDWARAKRIMDENIPTLSKPYEMGGYTIAKVWQERVVMKFAKANAWDLTIVRPGFIWGQQHAEIAGMGRHFGSVYIMFGPLTRLPLCHVLNCAHCLLVTVENSTAIGQIFNLVDSDEIRVWRYLSEYVRGTKKRGFLLPVPYIVAYGFSRLALATSKALFGKKAKLPSLLAPRRFEAQFKPIRFSNQKLRQVLAWKPPLTFDQCLTLTYGSKSKVR